MAGRQRGRVARRQLVAVGVSAATIDWQLQRERLFHIHHAVYAVGHTASVEFGDETAALLACGDTAVLSHSSASALWGLSPAQDVIHVTVRQDRRPTLPGVLMHRSRCLIAPDLRIRHGLPVVSPARALLDLAAHASDRRLELAYDRARVDHLVRPPELAALLARSVGVKGAARLRALMNQADHPTTVTRSEAEERLLALIRAAELPEPRVNTRLHGYEVDFYWPAHQLVVEVDGYRYHSTRRAFEHDRRKDATLRAAGLPPIRITWQRLDQQPYAVIARIAQALVQPVSASQNTSRPSAMS